jgi:hypothetical protein
MTSSLATKYISIVVQDNQYKDVIETELICRVHFVDDLAEDVSKQMCREVVRPRKSKFHLYII